MNYFRTAVKEMQGYVPGYQPVGDEYLKLNTNENPYPPAPGVFSVLRSIDPGLLRLYPDPVLNSLRERIASNFGVARENVLIGNGSDEVLTIVTRSFVEPGETVVFPEPSYSLYPVLARIQGGVPLGVPLGPDFGLPDEFVSVPARLKFLAFPNSPTGTAYPLELVERVLKESSGVVLIDEAYADFADENCFGLLARHPNLIILRTFSKSYGLAGLRVGFALASEELIAGMLKVKDSYNVNRLSAAIAEAALSDQDYLRRTVAAIRRERGRLSRELEALGFEVFPSSSNFVLVRAGTPASARRIFEELRERRILVRYFAQPRLDDCLRITVGTPEAMDRLIGALREIAGAHPGGEEK
ncbi:MAG TPA: histidinol-phosphate transaminase [bacterium]|nr:histidinol-phosphate transaminase [bacterium]HPJ71922.1 histidinol-phosphate transaminase [bacterium]HPQ65576.1 histidinol-phosphate transaminase [bacterium]